MPVLLLPAGESVPFGVAIHRLAAFLHLLEDQPARYVAELAAVVVVCGTQTGDEFKQEREVFLSLGVGDFADDVPQAFLADRGELVTVRSPINVSSR